MDAPRLRIRKIDILDQPAEALIYSANVELNCSGGVGGALVDRYGAEVQTALHGLLANTEKRRATQGNVFEQTLPGMPYRAVFHTIPTNRWHQTNPAIVAQVLEQALNRCVEREIRSVALSALATGFGDLIMEDFLLLADGILHDPAFQPIGEVTLCLNDAPAFALALKLIETRKLDFQVI